MGEEGKRPLIGILGGSFNPVHVGHMIVAAYIKEFTDLDEVWLTLSPRNPLKAHPLELIPDINRLEMLNLATRGVPGVGVCDLELSMPRPSYTINTLRTLRRRYPGKDFRLIIGSDNWRIFSQWREADAIIEEFGVIVYPRPGYTIGAVYDDQVEVIDAPRVSLSSTFIRQAVARGKDVRCFVPAGVFDYICQNKLYGYRGPTENDR